MTPRAGIDIAYIGEAIRRNFWFIVAAMVMFLCIGVLVILVLPEKYKVTATLKVNDSGSKPIVEKLFDGVDVVAETGNTSNEIALLKSFSLLRRALELMDVRVAYFRKAPFRSEELFVDRPFTVVVDSSVSQLINVPVNIRFINDDEFVVSLEEGDAYTYHYGARRIGRKVAYGGFTDTVRIGDTVEWDNIKFRVYRNGTVHPDEAFSIYFQNLDQLTENYRDDLVISPVSKESSILELNITSSVPEKEIQLINELVKLYVEQRVISQNMQAQRTLDFINRQLGEISDSLHSAEIGLQQFRSNNRVLDLNYESKNVYDELKSLEKQRSDEQSKLKYYNYLSNYVGGEDKDLNKMIAPTVIGIQDVALNDLVAALSGYVAEKTAINYSARSKNPKYNILQENIDQTRAAIIENVQNIQMASEIKLKEIDKRLRDVQQKVNTLPETERILLDAQRKFNFNDNIYNYYLEKQGEAAILLESNAPYDVIVDPARIEGDKPVSPNKPLILAGCLALGMFLPLGFVFVRDATSTRIQDRQDIYRYLPQQLVVLQDIPKAKRKRGATTGAPNRRTLEAFRSLRLKIDKRGTARTIALTSPVADDGKTYCARYLCEQFSAAGKRVLVIDLCLEEPALTKALMRGAAISVAKPDAAAWTVADTPAPNIAVAVLPAAKMQNVLESKERLDAMLNEALTLYDYVVIDCPDLTSSATFLAVNDSTDLNLVVIRRNHSPMKLGGVAATIGNPKKYGVLFNCAEI